MGVFLHVPTNPSNTHAGASCLKTPDPALGVNHRRDRDRDTKKHSIHSHCSNAASQKTHKYQSHLTMLAVTTPHHTNSNSTSKTHATDLRLGRVQRQ